MPEVTESEYRAKEREKNRYEQEKRACERKIASLDDEIRELERAIKKMTTVYEEFKGEVKKLDRLLDEKRDFSGKQNRELVEREGESLLIEGKRCQKNVVNYALDQRENLCLEKRKKRNEQYGLLGKIQSAIDSVWTWMKTNWFNN